MRVSPGSQSMAAVLPGKYGGYASVRMTESHDAAQFHAALSLARSAGAGPVGWGTLPTAIRPRGARRNRPNSFPHPVHQSSRLRARLKIARGPAARDFGGGQGGELGASPPWAVTTEPTPATGKRPAARRDFAPSAAGLCCSLSRRPMEGILLRRASPGSPFPENRTPRSFRTGSRWFRRRHAGTDFHRR